MFKDRFRKNSGSRDASEVVSFTAPEKEVVTVYRKNTIATFENRIEKNIFEKEAISTIVQKYNK